MLSCTVYYPSIENSTPVLRLLHYFMFGLGTLLIIFYFRFLSTTQTNPEQELVKQMTVHQLVFYPD